MPGHPRQGIVYRPRAGYSLMELFLVIAILSVVTMLVFPSLSKPLNQSIAQEAGQTLLRDLTTARAEAIESGLTILFQFQEGTGRYYLGSSDQRGRTPADRSEFDSSHLNQYGSTFESDSSGSNNRSRAQEIWPRSLDFGIRELPGQVTFVAAASREAKEKQSMEIENDSRSTQDDPVESKSAGQEVHSDQLPGDRVEPAKWSAPLRFYPSGRMMPAHILLEAETGATAEIEIQRLAGRIRLHVAR